MTQAASVRPDSVPIVNAMGALNGVSRAVNSGQEPPPGLTVVGLVAHPILTWNYTPLLPTL
ncbi:hypothetical protein BDW66DRAFT_143820 [Aspergillus desertorum]